MKLEKLKVLYVKKELLNLIRFVYNFTFIVFFMHEKKVGKIFRRYLYFDEPIYQNISK